MELWVGLKLDYLKFCIVCLNLGTDGSPSVSYLILQAKSSTHRMCAQELLFHTHEHKVFTDSQMSRVSIFIT
jgi:hypothetical protein